MKALVYNGPGKKSVEEKPRPDIAAPTDAVVKLLKTTICGTDLHILKGDVPTCTPGRILGHEGVGIVRRLGPGVSADIKVGDRVGFGYTHKVCGNCDCCKSGESHSTKMPNNILMDWWKD